MSITEPNSLSHLLPLPDGWLVVLCADDVERLLSGREHYALHLRSIDLGPYDDADTEPAVLIRSGQDASLILARTPMFTSLSIPADHLRELQESGGMCSLPTGWSLCISGSANSA